MAITDKVTSHEKMTIRYSIQWNVMIITISLLDEIYKFLFLFKDLSDDEIMKRIDAFKHMIEPILNEFNKWPDLRKFRNNVLAHNFRIDIEDFKSVHLANRLHTYNIPQSSVDLYALCSYLDSIAKIAKNIFKEEYNEAITIIDSFNKHSDNLTQSINDEIDKANIVLDEVNKRINEYNFLQCKQ